jgi:hypothetical protein
MKRRIKEAIRIGRLSQASRKREGEGEGSFSLSLPYHSQTKQTKWTVDTPGFESSDLGPKPLTRVRGGAGTILYVERLKCEFDDLL